MTDIRRGITEIALEEWRTGSIQAERLCSGLLSIEGFESINPQATLGGSDGLKDIICVKNSKKFVAAVYFPPTDKKFSDIKVKFKGDIEGVKKNNVDGFIFLVNHRLSLDQQEELENIAKDKKCILFLYPLERMRGLLDSPMGYGYRQQFLNIDMTKEELISVHSLWQKNLQDIAMSHPSAQFLAERMFHTNTMMTQLVIGEYKKHLPHDMKSIINITGNSEIPLTSVLSINLLLFIHKIIAPEGQHSPGKIRTVQTWVGLAEKPMSKAIYIPPRFEKVPKMLSNLINNWNRNFGLLYKTNKEKKIWGISSFHVDFLSIHPFVDGNGRVARVLMDQQIEDLLGIKTHILFDKRKSEYFQSLQQAQKGNKKNLYLLLRREIQERIHE